MSEHMRAMRQQVLGGPEVLLPVEVERPVPGPTEVLVEVHAAGVNPVDWTVRRHGLFLTPPYTVGWDVSGVVAAVGAGVTRFQAGDEVYGMPHFPRAAGGYAEYVTAPSRHLARKPAALSHVEAAALPLAGLTAWQALVDTAGVRTGDRVLVHAAAGGVGHLAVQIAKARGAYVVATASVPRHELLRGWGADVCVDYRTEDFTAVARDMDVVLDTVGGDYEERSLGVLRPDGLLVSIVAVFAAQRLAAKAQAAGRRAVTLLVEPDQAGLAGIAALADGGQLKPLVAAVFPLEEAGRAHELGEGGHTAGKIVLTVAR
ncbi:NADP-dependent oxidoreductase [Catellatospora vulcania]|uniref:NADP-dependent oxidoreductase n=1 Tax=Catellatospora vulcania TaxID=1460450 RepID=UPI0012D405DE|nr:NADP-dependent oxidoreductase [Catellatospora vulcania]